MLVHLGWKLYGTVHQVPCVARVATVFFHIWWVPLAPVRSYIVIDGPEPPVGARVPAGDVKRTRYGFVGVRVPFSWWSVSMAYTRGVLGVLLSVTGLSTIVFTYEAARGGGMTPAAAAVNAFLACYFGLSLWLSRWLTRAGWSKANELRAALGLPLVDEV